MQPNKKYSYILSLIENKLTFPYPPALAVQILDAVPKGNAALSELEEIISTDSALTTKILKAVNSGIFICNDEITNIKQAMSMLGANIIKNIALSFVIVAELNNNEHTNFDFDHFWRRSVTAAVSAELLSKALQYKNDDIFVSALLHDLGMLVISLTKGNEYNPLLKEARLSDIDLIDLEKGKYGFNHQQVGYTLLTSWHLPDSVSESILYHHQPDDTPETCRKSAEILYFADQLSAICNKPETAEKARLLQQRLVEHFGIDKTQALKLLDAAATNSHEIIEIFGFDPGDIKPYSLLLKEANTEFGKLNLSNEQMVLEMKEAKEKAERLAHELRDTNSHLKKTGLS
jgi:HD-like signal output (HDOD) protein